MIVKRKRFSIAEKSQQFSETKAKLVKSPGVTPSIFKTILSLQDAVKTKSGTSENAAKKIKALKLLHMLN